MRWVREMMNGFAARLVSMAGLLVPSDRRAEWREEWEGELMALEDARAPGTTTLPSALGFALGAVPHALSIRVEDWTMEGSFQDIRFALRVLWRAPAFTLVAVLTLALGIGANGAIFSMVNGLMFRVSPGIEEPDRLVQVARSYESAPRWDNFSWPAFRVIEAESRTLQGVAGYQTRSVIIGRGTNTDQVVTHYVSGDYFELLGLRPVRGRLLGPTDNVVPGGHPTVVLGHSLWARRFGGDPDVVGSMLSIGAVPYEIVGVGPVGFAGIDNLGSSPDLFMPAMQVDGSGDGRRYEEWGSSWINLFGRLAEGATLESARVEMDVVSTALRAASVENGDMEVLLAPGVGLDPESRTVINGISLILLVIVGVVLLLACTNVANLSLARASARKAEIGVRVALGAGRARVARQLITESTLVALMATALAVPIVMISGRYLPLLFPTAIAVPLGADWRVYLLLGGVGLFAGVVCGLAPAWAISHNSVSGALGDRVGTETRGGKRLADALVVAQLALSLGLIAGAALLARSVQNAASAEPGFQPGGVMAASVNLGATGRYDDASGLAFFSQLTAAAAEAPGVRSVALASQMPIAGGHSRRTVRPLGGGDDDRFEAEYTVVGGGYFETLGIPILEGRALRGVRDETEPVVVVNQVLANRFWPGESAIGKELEGQPPLRVVGVAGDVQMRSLRASANPGVYYPMSQEYSAFMALHVAFQPGAGSPDALAGIIASVDPEIPISSSVDLQSALVTSMGETMAIGRLVAVFAALALLLAVVGLYGLISHGASRRVREMGIRVALGADPRSLVRLVLVKGVVLAGIGLVLGFGVSIGVGIALESLLFGVVPSDPGALVPAAGMLLVAAGVAAWIPARRASRVDAAVSLRNR